MILKIKGTCASEFHANVNCTPPLQLVPHELLFNKIHGIINIVFNSEETCVL